MFVVTVTFEIVASQVDAFRSAVLTQAENSLEREPDCARFDVCFDPDSPTRVFLYELYIDEPAFREHVATDHFRDFDARTKEWVLDKVVSTWQLQWGTP